MALGVAWFVAESLQPLPLPSSDLLFVSSLLIKTLVIGFRAHPFNPGRTHVEILSLNISTKIFIPKHS